MSVSSVTPNFGTTNTLITIEGTGLNNISHVRMGTLARIDNASTPTMLKIYAPPSLINQKIILTTTFGQEIDADFFYYLNPSIEYIEPTEGIIYTEVSIYGYYLTDISYVLFGNVSADFYLSDNTIFASAPVGSGSKTVSAIDRYGNIYPGPLFTYQSTIITSIVPTGGPAGSLVTLNGDYLLDVDRLYVGGQLATIEVTTKESLEWIVPPGEGNASIEIMDFYNVRTTFDGSFQYQNPKVTYFTPSEGPSSSEVFVYGRYLNRTSNVSFGGINASFRTITTGLVVTVPPSSGNVSVQIKDPYQNSQYISFYYQNPSISSINPSQGMENTVVSLFGEYLENTTLVRFGVKNVSVLRVNTSMVEVSAPFLLENVSVQTQDLFGNVAMAPTQFTPLPSIRSSTCFPSGTTIQTDQGILEIQKLIVGEHTIRGQPIRAITCTLSMDDTMVCIEKDALRKGSPHCTTLISRRHKIYYKRRMISAQRLVGKKGIMYVPYPGIPLYNVVLASSGRMVVHGMICETLDPTNPIAPYFQIS